jgi:hypothetical protein
MGRGLRKIRGRLKKIGVLQRRPWFKRVRIKY